MDALTTLLYLIAGALILAAAVFLRLKHRAETSAVSEPVWNGRAMKWMRRGMTLLCLLLALCVIAMLLLTGGFLWQEHYFAVLAETGVPDLRAAPHTPYYILMYQLGGLCIMLLSLLLLLRNGTKTAP